jgi:hypothetical protein
MPSSGVLHPVVLVRTGCSGERISNIIRVKIIDELGTILADVPSMPILLTLKMKVKHSSERSVLTRATGRNISEDGILHSHRCEDPKS